MYCKTINGWFWLCSFRILTAIEISPLFSLCFLSILVGLLERPVEIQTGKRNRRKVERLAENISSPPVTADKKKFSIPAGEGVKLGDSPASE